MAVTDRVIDLLDQALDKTLGLHRADDVKDWLDAAQWDRAYMVKPKVRIAHHFDLEPAFLIRDSLLGTLGIVHRVESKPDPADQVRRYVDSATYVRHLLLRDPLRRNAPALTVELVLLADDDPVITHGIGEALRELLRKTDSLFHVGISLLLDKGGDDPFGHGLRRGLPWLLTATRHWLDSDLSKPPKPKAEDGSTAAAVPATPAAVTSANGRLETIKLSNYRLPGSRQFKLANARVHLVHGANGSGKSTLVEALELLSSARVERLDRANVEDYAEVIKNRASTAPATIEIRRGNQAEVWSVVKTGLDKPPSQPVHASSFRLDQALMDRLVGNFPHERAEYYVKAFSPESSTAAFEYSDAAKRREDGFQKIRNAVGALKSAREGLESVQAWRNDNVQATTERFPDLLNRWLECTALADLARREHAVRATLRKARDSHWVGQDPAIALLGSADQEPGPLAELMQRWAREERDLQGSLNKLRASTESSGGTTAAAQTISQDQCEALNRVGPWLFESQTIEDYGAFGDKLVKVLGGEAPTYGTTLIIGGAEGWATPVLTAIDALSKSCQDLLQGRQPFTWPGQAEWPDFKDAADLEKKFADATGKLTEGFLALLKAGGEDGTEFDRTLIAAVNELMALFTPARWSYEDIRLPSSVGDGKIAVSMHLGSKEHAARADLHLNTAELNLFTIALFLLCAGRVRKPLGLLVLDDPLQNMDELTSTALARGMAKVIRAWERTGRDEELLLLFHGNEDLARFQEELSGAIYRLPWLSPGQGLADGPPIEAERMAARGAAVQSLDKLIEKTPPAPAGAAR
jgi:hypothetical protein